MKSRKFSVEFVELIIKRKVHIEIRGKGASVKLGKEWMPEVIIMKSRRKRKSDSNTVKEAERSALKIAVTDPLQNR